MALLRLLARDTDCLALLPSVVVQDELVTGRLVEHAVVPDLYEHFYAVTVQRRFEAPLVQSLLRRSEDEVLLPPSGVDQVAVDDSMSAATPRAKVARRRR
jgi:LysR family transcriptional regulator, transcriptional activator of nhaA